MLWDFLGEPFRNLRNTNPYYVNHISHSQGISSHFYITVKCVPYFPLPCMIPKHYPNLSHVELAFFFLDTTGSLIRHVLFLGTWKWLHCVCECKVFVCIVRIGPAKHFLRHIFTKKISFEVKIWTY